MESLKLKPLKKRGPSRQFLSQKAKAQPRSKGRFVKSIGGFLGRARKIATGKYPAIQRRNQRQLAKIEAKAYGLEVKRPRRRKRRKSVSKTPMPMSGPVGMIRTRIAKKRGLIRR